MKLRATLTLALGLGVLPLSTGAMWAPACASEGPRAVLVVDTGSGSSRFCVALPADRVSGIELIRLANQQHGLQYRFGFGGNAVCQLANVGPSGDDCFAEDPYFWGYWRGDASGGWTWSSTGAGSTVVRNGGVEGWSWGTGRDGNSHPRPPVTSFDSVCPKAPPVASKGKTEPSSGSGGGPSGSSRTKTAGTMPPDDDEEDPESDASSKKKKRKRRDRPVPAGRVGALRADGSASPPAIGSSDPLLASSAITEKEERGLPGAGIAGLLLAALMGGAGLWIARRRSSPGSGGA